MTSVFMLPVSLSAAEHPRLFFSAAEVPKLREKALTPEGQVIVKRLRELLAKPVPMEQVQGGETRFAGLWTAGQAFLYTLTGEKAEAEKARALADTVVNAPVIKMQELRRGTRYMGVAIAYDLCYDAWPEDYRLKVATYLQARAEGLNTGSEGTGDNDAPQSNHNVEGRTQMGVIALAILNDPGVANAGDIVTSARQHLDGWLSEGVGPHGWGTEGQAFTINCLNWGVFQFAECYQRIMKTPVTQKESMGWILPLLRMQIVGTHVPYYANEVSQWNGCSVFGSAFWVEGIPFSPPAMQPVLRQFYLERFGLKGPEPLKIVHPAEAIWLLSNLDTSAAPTGAVAALPLSLQDERQGYHLFRNRFQDADDCLVVAYLHSKVIRKSWRCSPEIRLWGLGGRWVNFDPTRFNDKRSATPAAAVTGYTSGSDGSGKVSGKGQSGSFSLAVDYSARSGCAMVAVFAEDNTEPLTLNLQAEGTVTGKVITLRGTNGAIFHATLIAPTDGVFTQNNQQVTAPAASCIVFSLQSGKRPVIPDADGRGARIGNLHITRDGAKVEFSDK